MHVQQLVGAGTRPYTALLHLRQGSLLWSMQTGPWPPTLSCRQQAPASLQLVQMTSSQAAVSQGVSPAALRILPVRLRLGMCPTAWEASPWKVPGAASVLPCTPHRDTVCERPVPRTGWLLLCPGQQASSETAAGGVHHCPVDSTGCL